MEKEWAPVIAALIAVLGALGGAVIGGAITYYVKRQELNHLKLEEERKHIRLKLEELHELFAAFQSNCNEHCLYLMTVKNDRDFIFKYTESMKSVKRPLGLLYSMLYRYIPEKESDWQTFINSFGKFFDTTFKFSNNSVSFQDLQNSVAELDVSCQFMMRIVAEKLEQGVSRSPRKLDDSNNKSI